MILAAGLTPAWQQILVFDGLHLGQVNRTQQAHLCASGKVLNAGLALHQLGGPNRSLSILGGAAGAAIDREFTALGVEHDWVWAKAATRMCTTILDRLQGVTTELVENARPVENAELEQFIKTFEDVVPTAQVVVLSGSLPAGTPKDLYRNLIERTKAPVILDASGPELLEALPSKPFCVKPNREELSRTLKRDLHSEKDLRNAVREICRLGAKWAMVSQGAGDILACGGGRDFLFSSLNVVSINPIGSGDCLAAGTAWGLANGMQMLEAIRIGIAAGADNATRLLPARLDRDQVFRLRDAVTYSEI